MPSRVHGATGGCSRSTDPATPAAHGRRRRRAQGKNGGDVSRRRAAAQCRFVDTSRRRHDGPQAPARYRSPASIAATSRKTALQDRSGAPGDLPRPVRWLRRRYPRPVEHEFRRYLDCGLPATVRATTCPQLATRGCGILVQGQAQPELPRPTDSRHRGASGGQSSRRPAIGNGATFPDLAFPLAADRPSQHVDAGLPDPLRLGGQSPTLAIGGRTPVADVFEIRFSLR
jgi:hypothetical protein